MNIRTQGPIRILLLFYPPEPQFMCHYYKVSLPTQLGSVTQVKCGQKTTLGTNKLTHGWACLMA